MSRGARTGSAYAAKPLRAAPTIPAHAVLHRRDAVEREGHLQLLTPRAGIQLSFGGAQDLTPAPGRHLQRDSGAVPAQPVSRAEGCRRQEAVRAVLEEAWTVASLPSLDDPAVRRARVLDDLAGL